MLTIIASALAVVSAQPSDAPRKAYSTCLGEFVRKSTSDKLAKDAFETGLKSACATQEAAFRKSIIDYDMKTGVKQADAEQGAQLQIDDYMANARDSYEAPQ